VKPVLEVYTESFSEFFCSWTYREFLLKPAVPYKYYIEIRPISIGGRRAKMVIVANGVLCNLYNLWTIIWRYR